MGTQLTGRLRGLRPTLNPGVFAFCRLPPEVAVAGLPVVGLFRETEGTTVILPEAAADAHHLTPAFRAAWLTLGVESDLAGVGLTAAVAGVLAEAGIACNVVAAVHHDHLFVPAERGPEALAVLNALAERS
jgi:hypothetical protein